MIGVNKRDPYNEHTLNPRWRSPTDYPSEVCVSRGNRHYVAVFTSFYLAILTQILVKPGLNGLKAAKPPGHCQKIHTPTETCELNILMKRFVNLLLSLLWRLTNSDESYYLPTICFTVAYILIFKLFFFYLFVFSLKLSIGS